VPQASSRRKACPPGGRCALRWRKCEAVAKKARPDAGTGPSPDAMVQTSPRAMRPVMCSAWRIASATIVRVGLQAAPEVNWLPSET
jgi:hypothetical protein